MAFNNVLPYWVLEAEARDKEIKELKERIKELELAAENEAIERAEME